MKTIFKDGQGKDLYVLGLQAHNSSNGCWEMIDRDIAAVKAYHGNTLEVPVYWYQIEPEEGHFQFDMVKELIHRIRKSGLHLILLWFGFSKNADLTYMPEWAKRDVERFRLAVNMDGSVVPMMSPHCHETIEADKKAFVKLMEFLRAEDEKERTVIAVQVENELGYYPNDRCYSKKAQEDFDKGVPKELDGVVLEGADATGEGNSWYDRFGRHANEAFSSWYFGVAIEEIASAGKKAYPGMVFTLNTIVGEVRQEIAGGSYSSGAPVGRVLEIWKKAAPSIDAFCPDIYAPFMSGYLRICKSHSKLGNPLFIPETGTSGDSFAMNHLHAAVDYAALGICGFGAEGTIDNDGNLKPESKKVADSMQMIQMMSSKLLQYAGTDKMFCVTQEEFQSYAYVQRAKWHLTFTFSNRSNKGRIIGGGLRVVKQISENPEYFDQRGRAIVYEANPSEYYMTGTGCVVRFLRRADPDEHHPSRIYSSRAATELTALTVEEGHFDDNGNWVCEFNRRGDEIDFGAFLYPGMILRVKLNPDICKVVDW